MNLENLNYILDSVKRLKNQIILDLYKILYIRPIKLIKLFKQVDNFFISFIKFTTNNAPLREFKSGNQKYYKYDKSTPLLDDNALRETWLTKVNLNSEEESELSKILEKRRELMDFYECYDFTKCWYLHKKTVNKVYLENNYPWLKFYQKKIYNYLLENGLTTKSRFAQEYLWDSIEYSWHDYRNPYVDWEEWKHNHGFYHEEDFLKFDRSDLLETDENFLKQFQEEKRNDLNYYRGDWTFRVRPYFDHDDDDVYEDEEEWLVMDADHTKLWLNYDTVYWKNHYAMKRKNAFWQRDIYRKKPRWFFAPPDYIKDWQSWSHKTYITFIYDNLPKAIRACTELSKYSKFQNKVKNSWDFLLNKNVSISEKAKAWVKGDLWLQDRIDPKSIPLGNWGNEWEKHQKGETSMYDDSIGAERFGARDRHEAYATGWDYDEEDALLMYKSLVYWNQGLREFLSKAELDVHWYWLNPLLLGNRIFLDVYWTKWLDDLDANGIKDPFKDPRSPDIFWFKYVRRDILYLRRADGTILNNMSYHDWGILKNAERTWERLWIEHFEKATQEESFDFFFGLDSGEYYGFARIPEWIIPEYIWVKKYKYNGPKLWTYVWGNKNRLAGKFSGPTHINREVKYTHWYEMMMEADYLIRLRRVIRFNNAAVPWLPLNVLELFFILSSFCFIYWFYIHAWKTMWPIQCKMGAVVWDVYSWTYKGKKYSRAENYRLTEPSVARHKFNYFIYRMLIIPGYFFIMGHLFMKCEVFSIYHNPIIVIWSFGCFASISLIWGQLNIWWDHYAARVKYKLRPKIYGPIRYREYLKYAKCKRLYEPTEKLYKEMKENRIKEIKLKRKTIRELRKAARSARKDKFLNFFKWN